MKMAFYASTTGDWLENIKNLLIDNWDSSKTDNTTPKIRLITDPALPKKLSFRYSDYILIYEENSDENVADVGYYGRSQEMSIALDIRTERGRSRANKLYSEAESIILANRKSPADSEGNSLGMSYLVWRGSTDLTNKRYRTWRYVARVDAFKPYQAVS